MTRHSVALLVTFLNFQAATVLADDGPAKDVPELQALSNYLGTWDVAITSQDSPFAKGESTSKWILDGKFVQQTGSVTSADGATVLKITTLMTYDQRKKAYRMWSFLSNGTATESSGKWDEKDQTMTSVRRGDGTTTTTTAKFAEGRIENWTIVTTNQNNEVVGTFSGTNTRRKQ